MFAPGGGRGAEEGAGEQLSLHCMTNEWQVLAVGLETLWHMDKHRTLDKHTVGDRGANKVGRHPLPPTIFLSKTGFSGEGRCDSLIKRR